MCTPRAVARVKGARPVPSTRTVHRLNVKFGFGASVPSMLRSDRKTIRSPRGDIRGAKLIALRALVSGTGCDPSTFTAQMLKGAFESAESAPFNRSASDESTMRINLFEESMNFGPSITTMHVPRPEHSGPNHPMKSELGSGMDLRFTFEPKGKSATQIPGQSIPGGLETILPAPSPVSLVVSLAFGTNGSGLVRLV